ncbi:unnamed protein product [Protopolystoma xenopodis]|uniref:Uncharacterized protein n=1 Tax=Protopolystoma xenopodis TaxID=117903 RepID=A0A3S5B5N4_9PLAT|nr:unnamed protein product [Protopolystoma xenopodis]
MHRLGLLDIGSSAVSSSATAAVAVAAAAVCASTLSWRQGLVCLTHTDCQTGQADYLPPSGLALPEVMRCTPVAVMAGRQTAGKCDGETGRRTGSVWRPAGPDWLMRASVPASRHFTQRRRGGAAPHVGCPAVRADGWTAGRLDGWTGGPTAQGRPLLTPPPASGDNAPGEWT